MAFKQLIPRLFLIIVIANGYAQADSLFVIPRADGIIFDGQVDEAAWEAISPLPMVQYEPNAGAPPTEKTEIRLAYDDTYIYASIRA